MPPSSQGAAPWAHLQPDLLLQVAALLENDDRWGGQMGGCWLPQCGLSKACGLGVAAAAVPAAAAERSHVL